MKPIFIGGCPRSGTTLLGSLLGSHPRCITTPESQFKIAPLAAQFQRNDQRLTPQIISQVLRHWRFRLWNLAILPEQLMRLTPIEQIEPFMNQLVTEYARANGKQDFDYWVDHTPANLRHVISLREHFPNARYIHVVRDGRAVAASLFKVIWGPNTAKAAAGAWLKLLSFGLAAEQILPRECVLRIHFEHLVSAPEETLQRICEFCELEYCSSMLAGTGFSVPRYTKGQHRLVGQAPDPNRSQGWKQELTHREVEVFEYYTSELLQYLGYELQYGLQATPPSTWEQIGFVAQEGVMTIWHKCLFALRKLRTLKQSWKPFGNSKRLQGRMTFPLPRPEHKCS